MNEKQVLEYFKRIGLMVNKEKFNFDIPSDCFLHVIEGKTKPLFQYSEEILNFIENAVIEKLNQ